MIPRLFVLRRREPEPAQVYWVVTPDPWRCPVPSVCPGDLGLSAPREVQRRGREVLITMPWVVTDVLPASVLARDDLFSLVPGTAPWPRVVLLHDFLREALA